MPYTNEQRNEYNRKYYHENKDKTQAYNNRKCEKKKLERRQRKELQELGLWKSEKQKEKEKATATTPPTPPPDDNDIYGTIIIDKGLFIIEW